MKPGVSSLNPYAASYIPLSKRKTHDHVDVNSVPMEYFFTGNETSWCMPPVHGTDSQYHRRDSIDSDSHGNGKDISPEIFIKETPPSPPGSCGSLLQSSNQVMDKQIMDDELDMDMEFLKIHFPGLSDQSIADVYFANNGDIEATLDMLNHLEMYNTESLPDTLDIGDISESGTSTTSTLKLKNVAGETGASSSGSSDSAVPS